MFLTAQVLCSEVWTYCARICFRNVRDQKPLDHTNVCMSKCTYVHMDQTLHLCRKACRALYRTNSASELPTYLYVCSFMTKDRQPQIHRPRWGKGGRDDAISGPSSSSGNRYSYFLGVPGTKRLRAGPRFKVDCVETLQFCTPGGYGAVGLIHLNVVEDETNH